MSMTGLNMAELASGLEKLGITHMAQVAAHRAEEAARTNIALWTTCTPWWNRSGRPVRTELLRWASRSTNVKETISDSDADAPNPQ